jgi:Protein of unknown function (DUF1565)
MRMKMFVVLAAISSLSATALVGLSTNIASANSPSAEHVSTTGTDTGNCISSPCATINYAISVAPAGTTIDVAAGTYHQTVDISEPIDLQGAGAGKTVLNGAGLDPGGTLYGIIYVGTTGGLTTIQGFTITNPYPYAYTSGEPEAIALKDETSSDAVYILDNKITEGTADSQRANDFPIGIDTFVNAATTVIEGNTISGFFQGALLEDNGPATVSDNTFEKLIANQGYPGEGVFFLSDLAGSLRHQDATSNTFKEYSGYGVAMNAGYSNGNCSSTPCNGSISGTITKNKFALTAGTPAAAAIALSALDTGNVLTVSISKNSGYVTSPSVAVSINASGGGTINYTERSNSISVKS